MTVDKETGDQDLTFFLTSQKAQSDFSRTNFYNLGNTVCTSHCFKKKQSKIKVYFTIQKFFSTIMRSNAKLCLYSILDLQPISQFPRARESRRRLCSNYNAKT